MDKLIDTHISNKIILNGSNGTVATAANNHLSCAENNNTIFQTNNNNKSTKNNSIEANNLSTTTTTPSESSEEEDESVRLRYQNSERKSSSLQHRRSLSENVILFPRHTTPSDKARCHMLNRQSSKSIAEEETQSEYQILPNVSLRKVAETMFLKDPQYKPRMGDQSTKSNPFTALAQLRGVKKILGANPSTYTAGVGDLFSSCFEMSSPFLKELSIFQKVNAKTNGNFFFGIGI